MKKAAARPEKRAVKGSVGCWAAAAVGPAGLSGWAVDGEAAGIAAAWGLPSVRDAAATAIRETGDSIGLPPVGSMLRFAFGSRAVRRCAALVRIGAATAAGREVLGASTASWVVGAADRRAGRVAVLWIVVVWVAASAALEGPTAESARSALATPVPAAVIAAPMPRATAHVLIRPVLRCGIMCAPLAPQNGNPAVGKLLLPADTLHWAIHGLGRCWCGAREEGS